MEHKETNRVLWGHARVYRKGMYNRIMQGYNRPYRTIQNHTWSFYFIWDRTGPYICDLTGPHETIQDNKRQYGTIQENTGT